MIKIQKQKTIKRLWFGLLGLFFLIGLLSNIQIYHQNWEEKSPNTFNSRDIISSKKEMVPMYSGNVSIIRDNITNIWDESGTAFTVEDGQIIKVIAKWNATYSSAELQLQKYESGSQEWNQFNTISPDPECIGTQFSNFTLTLYDDETTTTRLYLTVDNGSWSEEISQKYRIKSQSAPNINDDSENVKYGCIESGSQKGIILRWPEKFTDNIGIHKFKLARNIKSTFDTSNPINDDNFDSQSFIIETTDTEYIDYSVSENEEYYYAIKAIDYVGLDSEVHAISKVMYLDFELPNVKNSSIVKDSNKINIDNTTLNHDDVIKLEIEMEQDDLSSGYIMIQSENNPVIEFRQNLSPTNDINRLWETGEIELEKGIYLSGIYNLEIHLTDKMNNTNEIVIESAFYIPKAQQEPEPNWALIGGLSGGGVILVILGFVFYKRKRKKSDKKSEGIEFSKEKRKKRKGKIYSGASSVGKRSGQAADLLQKRRGKKGKSSKRKKKKIRKRKKGKAKIPKSKAKRSVSKEPSSVSKKISTKKISNKNHKEISKKPNAMQLKTQERKVDLKRRMNFLNSKIDSLNQNMELMKVILGETAKITESKIKCEKCGTEISQNWNLCPYCLLESKSEEIAEKKELIEKNRNTRICPKCNKILDHAWTECPYCLIEKNENE